MRWGWISAFVVQLGLLVGSAFVPKLGEPTWHHNATLAFTILFTAIFWRKLQSRRALGTGVLVSTVLALVSAFLLLYLKQELKDWELKDWAKFWHITWSWFALVFFVLHTWVNRRGLSKSLGAMRKGLLRKIAFDGVLVLILIAIPVTWSTLGAKWIVEANYILITYWTWLLFVGVSYSIWIATRFQFIRRRLPLLKGRPMVRFVDSWLIPITILANISGFPLLYFGTKETSLKYVAKYWHTWPSIAMAVLILAHTIQFLPALKRHLRSN